MKVFLQLILILALAVGPGIAQARSKRLILKDGSYQPATKWEVKGDRVRYFSAERYMWEEIPGHMIDWPATEKYEKDLAEGKLGGVAAEEPDAILDAPEPEPPAVAPGLRVPDTSGIFLLETFQNEPRLVEIVQNGSEINQQRTKNILRAVINPIPMGPTQTVELKGAHAAVQSHSTLPVLYINVDFISDDNSGRPQEPQTAKLERFRIVRLQQKKDLRVVGNMKVSLRGKIKEQRDFVPARSEELTGNWVKVTPAQPLSPGEYAVVEMLNPEQMNLYVWDFGVDPNAPPNRSTWKPQKPLQSQTGTNETPVLNKRPKY